MEDKALVTYKYLGKGKTEKLNRYAVLLTKIGEPCIVKAIQIDARAKGPDMMREIERIAPGWKAKLIGKLYESDFDFS